MKFLFALTFLGVAIYHASAAPEKMDCSKVDEVLDDLGSAQGLTTMSEKYKLATTEEEMKKRCTEMTDAIKQLRKYNKDCFNALTNQVFSAILRTRSDMNDAYCDPSSAKFKDALAASKCIQEQSLDSVREAEKKTILSSQVLLDSNIPDEKLRLRRACCSVHDGKKYFMEATKSKCAAHNSIYSEYVDSYTSESMGLICPNESSLECDKLEALKLDGVELKSSFFLKPMIKLVKTLDH